MRVSLCKDTAWLLSDEAFSIYAPCMYRPTLEKYKKQMSQYNSDPAVKVFVCELQCSKTGMLVLDRSGGVPEIIGIAVHERQRRQGVGKCMIRFAMESEQLESIGAQTDDEGIGFYRACGFAEEKIIREYPDGIAVRYNCVMTNGKGKGGKRT